MRSITSTFFPSHVLYLVDAVPGESFLHQFLIDFGIKGDGEKLLVSPIDLPSGCVEPGFPHFQNGGFPFTLSSINPLKVISDLCRLIAAIAWETLGLFPFCVRAV